MNIIKVLSPNFSIGRNGYYPEAIVIHIMEGTLEGTDSWFKNANSKVSAHYGIGVNGEVHNYVEETDTAWHAGRVNNPTWPGIKPAGNGLFINPNFYTIGIEHEGTVDSDWTETMYQTSGGLIAVICKQWNIPIDRSHIVKHHEIYSCKSCPGSKVDFEKLIQLSNKNAGAFDAATIISKNGTATTKTTLNLRNTAPSTKSPIIRVKNIGEKLAYNAYTDSGELVKNNSRWYKTPEGLWFWAGGVVV
jgi:N-acetylmuramoyl-L-alanine amidase